MLRTLFVVACVFMAVPVFAQTPDFPTEDMITAQDYETYPDVEAEAAADRARRRAPSQEVAQPRTARPRVSPPVSRRPIPYEVYDWRARRRQNRRFRADRYVCTGPYFVWVGRVQVLIPGTCF
jgi:hypothetical protein